MGGKMKRVSVVAAAVALAIAISGSSASAVGGVTYGLYSGDPTHAYAYFLYNDASGNQIRSYQTCVGGGHGVTYYGPWVDAFIVSPVATLCSRASISNYFWQQRYLV
jgi:hypothetical protein